jgi:hypothetical protein
MFSICKSKKGSWFFDLELVKELHLIEKKFISKSMDNTAKMT